MISFLGDVATALVDRSAERIRDRVVAPTVFYGAAGLCALAAIGFATAAGYMVLARSVGHIGAAAIIAALYAAAAAILVVLARQRDIARTLDERTQMRDSDAVAHLTAAFFTGLRAGRGRD